MPVTKSELMYFAAGVAVGGVAGANWSKIKPLLDQMLGPAAEGFGDAYSDLARVVSERFETAQDVAADRRHKANGNGKKKKKEAKKNKQAAAVPFDLARFMAGQAE